MTKREIASLACKILAVYALLQLPQYVQGIYFLLSGIFAGELWGEDIHRIQSLFWDLSTVFVPTVLYLVAGILLWRRSNALASRMVSDDQPPEGQPTISGQAVSAIAFSVVGLVVLVHAIPRIASILSYLISHKTMPEFEGRWTANVIAELTALGVQVILGAVLLMTSRGLSRLVMKIRTAGQNNSEQESHTQKG